MLNLPHLNMMKNMKLLWLLWLFVVLPTVVLGEVGFGRSYLKNSRLCHQWNCISSKLGLPDSLPSKQVSEVIFRNALPEGPWQEVIKDVLENCYENRTRRFTNTCPGQALLHCVVDQMIDFCPVSSLRKDDSCSPVTSLAGLKYMFAQSRYMNLEKNLPKDRRPTWFLKNYFDSKCCDLPVIFNSTVLQECGFTSFINYFDHGPRYTDAQVVNFQSTATSLVEAPKSVQTMAGAQTVFMPFDIPSDTPVRPTEEVTTAVYENTNGQRLPEYDVSGIPKDLPSDEITDPLDCCEMTNFVDPSWRSECDFHLNFKGQDRLVISSHAPATEAPTTTTTTERTNVIEDIMLVPQSCEKETCVFRLMGIITDTGILDIDAYIKMLDNFTDAHPAWARAKARVLTKCVAKPVRSFEAGCEINNMLACTLDVLTENCPYKRKSNICKHGKHEVPCQISSSKYRPKNRREICLLPELIHHSHLQECGLEALYKVEHVPVQTKPRKQGWFASRYTCQESKEPTKCMMTKMGVLNKYNFMDYFKMKDRIRQFTTKQMEWAALLDIYTSAFVNVPMYGDHCNSEKKLLNVLDAMLMTCPVSKRKNTAECNRIFTDMTHTAPNQNVTKERFDEIMKHYHHVFMPNQPETANLHQVIHKKHSKTVKKPVYDFAFLNPKDAPSVRIISLKPEASTRRPIEPPLIIPPVYLRPQFGQVNHGVLRSGYLLTKHPMSSNSTLPPIFHSVPRYYPYVYTKKPVSPVFTPTTPYYETTTELTTAETTDLEK